MDTCNTRRGLLAAILPAAAAVAFPAAAASSSDAAAILARAEHVVDVLTKNVVIDDRFDVLKTWYPAWFDHASAERMLAHLRAEAAGEPVTDESMEALLAFCRAHHQSFDYIVTGCVDTLIGWSASCAPAAFDDYAAATKMAVQS